MSKSMSTEMTVMSKLEALESPWDFSALHAELGVICPLEDSTMTCGGVWCVDVVC